jgi:hypothetical protein
MNTANQFNYIQIDKITSKDINSLVELDLNQIKGINTSTFNLEAKIENGKNIATLLVRQPLIDIIEIINSEMNSKQAINKKRIIRGPPGCGKSTVLYQAAQYCKSIGWIVFYIDYCNSIAKINAEQGAEDQSYFISRIIDSTFETNPILREILGSDEIKLAETIRNKIRNKRYYSALYNLVHELAIMKDDKHPVLFALDRWNTFLKCEKQNSLSDLLANFSHFRLKKGIILRATTSNFDPVLANLNFKVFFYSEQYSNLI